MVVVGGGWHSSLLVVAVIGVPMCLHVTPGLDIGPIQGRQVGALSLDHRGQGPILDSGPLSPREVRYAQRQAYGSRWPIVRSSPILLKSFQQQVDHSNQLQSPLGLGAHADSQRGQFSLDYANVSFKVNVEFNASKKQAEDQANCEKPLLVNPKDIKAHTRLMALDDLQLLKLAQKKA